MEWVSDRSSITSKSIHMSQITANDEVSEDEIDENEQEFEAPSISRLDWSSRGGKLRLFCFHCNRPEAHYNTLKHRWYYWTLNGMTFSLIRLLGPFRCRCCGHKRLLSGNKYHPQFIYRGWQAKKANERDKRRY